MAMALGSFASRVIATAVVAQDGTGDFTTIQAAVNSLPSTGGVVYIKEGTYIISTAITWTQDNIAIIGGGNGTLVRADANIAMISVGGPNAIIDRLRLNGNVQATSGISIGRNQGNIYITNCTIERINGPGVSIAGANNFPRIHNCYIFDNKSHGIHIAGGDDTIIMGNFIYDNWGHGIFIEA